MMATSLLSRHNSVRVAFPALKLRSGHNSYAKDVGTIMLQIVTIASDSLIAILSPSVQTHISLLHVQIITVDLSWQPSLVLCQTK